MKITKAKKSWFMLVLLLILSSFPTTSFSQTPLIGPNLAGFTSVSAAYTSYGASVVVSNNVSAGAYVTLGTSATAGDLYADAYITIGAGAVVGTQTIPNTLLSAQLQEIADAKAALSCLSPNFTPATATMGLAYTLVPGVYHYASALGIPANAVITFDGGGATNPVWIFNVDDAIVVAANVTINIINSGAGASIVWNPGAHLTVGAFTKFIGIVFAESYVVFAEGASLECGNVFSRTGYATFGTNENFTSSGCMGGATALLIVNCIALPIELLSFTGECKNQNIVFKWITATEHNNDYFSIEQSIDGLNWVNIRNIPGAGNSTSEITYSFIDFDRYDDISYYRLKQTDFDGHTKVYSPISVKKCFEMNDLLSIVPNPAIDLININYDGDIDQVLSTSIYDVFGKLVYFQKGYFSTIPVENIQEGIYYLHLVLESGIIVRKFCLNNKN